MKYEYTGNGLKEMRRSYKSDKKPFLTGIDMFFLPQCHRCEIIRTLKELFSPNYWSCGHITLQENERELKLKFDNLGQMFFTEFRLICIHRKKEVRL